MLIKQTLREATHMLMVRVAWNKEASMATLHDNGGMRPCKEADALRILANTRGYEAIEDDLRMLAGRLDAAEAEANAGIAKVCLVTSHGIVENFESEDDAAMDGRVVLVEFAKGHVALWRDGSTTLTGDEALVQQALDTFHANYGIDVLDDFEITVDVLRADDPMTQLANDVQSHGT